MPEEENKKLRDLVSETLQTKGVLGRIQAEIRASVFLALEEQDVFKDKSPFTNKPLKDFLKSSDGVTIISLVREFLEFFNLEFTSMVFDPETHSGLDYNYEGRSKLASTLNINDCDKHQPLLSQILKLSKAFLNTTPPDKDDRLLKEIPPTIKSGAVNELTNNILSPFTADEMTGESHRTIAKDVQDTFLSQNLSETSNKSHTNFNHKLEDRLNDKIVKESTAGAGSLSSLSNLPPIGKTSQVDVKDKKETYDLNALLDLSPDRHYEDDFISSESDHMKKGSKMETGSEESEVEEEISGISNLSGQLDDNTADISISKASGHGDYMENL
uniref:Putative fop n terminal dimerization domain protein n=1 Tax=Triatoma infestans TaxID=30076 RepID=A0A023F7F5_TRIIF